MIKTREWLIITRKNLGYSQKVFAEKCGINIFTVQNIEQGKRVGAADTWRKIIKYIEFQFNNELINIMVNDNFLKKSKLLSKYNLNLLKDINLIKYLKTYSTSNGTDNIIIFYDITEENINFIDISINYTDLYKEFFSIKTTINDAIKLIELNID